MALQCRIVRASNGSIDYIKTEEGTRSALFDSLVAIGNKDTAYDLYAIIDSDDFKEVYPRGEPSVEQLLKFVNNNDVILKPEEITDIKNSTVSLGMSSTGQLFNKLKSTFVSKGLTVFDRKKMESSGVYNSYEIDSIISNPSIQNSIKKIIRGMNNIESEAISEYDSSFVVKEGSLNSLGKQNVKNPFKVEKEIISLIAGSDIEQTLDKIPFDSIKNDYYTKEEFKRVLDDLAASNRIIQEKEIVGGQLQDKPKNKVYDRLSKVMDFSNKDAIASKIDFLTGISDTVWNTTQNSVYSLLKDLNKSSISMGVDLNTIENDVYKKEPSFIKSFLTLYKDVVLSPSPETLRRFADSYTEFFELEGNATRVAQTPRSYDIFLNTDLSEYQLFNDFGLIKKGDNIYTPVDIIENIDDVYATMAANTNLLPSSVTNEEELRNYVQQQLGSLDISDYEVEEEQMEKMVLYKMYFKSPFFSSKEKDITQQFIQFNGDYNYYTQEYPSDFYKEYLREKKANTAIFKNYYSKFDITENGIELIENDPITVDNLMQYISEDMRQYNMVSKNLNLPLDTIKDADFNGMIYNRENAISNPNSIPKLNKDFTILSPITIAVKNETETFVRTPVGVFEIDYQIGNVTFYNILPKGDSKYNSLGMYKTKTDSDLNLNEYGFLQDNPESFIKAKNYYSQSELKKINKEHFGCS